MSNERKQDARDVGSDSPPSKAVSEQQRAGERGGSRAEGGASTSDQPAQTSGGRDPAHEHEPTARRSFGDGQDPNAQGDGEPGPEQLKQRPSLQGAAGGAGGGQPRGSQRGGAEEQAQTGEPTGEHTRAGRQRASGDRDPQRPA
jgi:hypothetical protein